MQNFETFLLENLPTSKSIHPTYEKALQQMLIAGGKRFRPALLLGVVAAYNSLMLDGARHAAYAVELLHTYSLIHDDLPAMDDSPLRRGEPTLHVLYDEVTAILVGDALNTYSFEVLSNAPFSDYTRVKLIQELAKNGGLNGMVLGQAIDCYFENKPLNVADIKILHTNKTAKLIAASLKMGAIIVGQEELGDKLYAFGIKLGLLFQIQDDILDVTQSSEEAGKLTNNDEDKNSFVTILGLDVAMSEANALADELTHELNSFDENLKNELSPLLTKYINRHKN
ncbi:geranyltranstransferase [Sulfurimonas gotlandica GD1]|uniref:Geranyltranstransferase n=1 Tax=Sulfurimonas gotlandica (strain DSM 19862 / JCM 16533 / GD1) TaxID=929558 RepID=B6BLX8_SULGG|nr:polyprenyl synthetase family protein [Sulfurimonas gotlandica]EDZ61809.1 geranylgeranyl pyrophosphate synthetase [Sulfurimonas gotlandica GD1]EHP29448.1 geranyltranstransferase [Sulfurimonas gotlandica GD1]